MNLYVVQFGVPVGFRHEAVHTASSSVSIMAMWSDYVEGWGRTGLLFGDTTLECRCNFKMVIIRCGVGTFGSERWNRLTWG